ncbi:MAG TPA: protein kinase [Polyangiaceae bacterium]|nr:protein kinase [Polyangiaceae bacterium]
MPKTIGQYELLRELGRGGMGVVYLARDSRLGRRVAVKLLQADNPELTARFIVEAQATAQCEHENIVVIYEVGEHQGAPFMVLEYLQGQTLASLVEKSGPLQWSRAAEIMVAVSRALVRAHSLGIVHRDLKPENIFLTESGQVKVLDFGIAKVLREEARGVEGIPAVAGQVRATGMAGTLAYMSPEQWGLAGAVDHRADIWAVGMILFEVLTGQNPLLADLDRFQERVTRLDWPMPLVQTGRPDLANEFAAIVDRCLMKRADDRFASAEELLKALEPWLPGAFRAFGNFDRGPYTGLRAFQEEDAACFFGRNSEIAAMVARVFDYPMLAVVGPSGSGKSSLIRAGVLPALRSSGTSWQMLVVRPGPQPMVALATMLHSLSETFAQAGEALVDPMNLAIRLRLEPGYLGQVLRKLAQHISGKCLLFVDQFEELYTLCDSPEQRKAFTQCLAGAADDAVSPVRLMISVRSDFLGRLSEDNQFMSEISRGLFFLGTPGREPLRQALVQPAEMVGYRFESEQIVEEMVSKLESTPGALPLLQFTAFQLWERRDAGRKLLTRQSYEAIGGVSGALATHADQVLAKQSPEARMICRALFLQLVTPERTRAVRELDDLYELVTDRTVLRQVLDDLVQSRLLVLNTGGGNGRATIEIVHESLIGAWLTLRRWLEESHEDGMFLEQLRAAARQWVNKNKDSGLLWTGEMAEELFGFRKRYKGELADTVKAFADAVQSAALRRVRVKKLLTLAGVGTLLGLLAAAAVALVVISQARKQAEQNETVARQAEVQAQQRLLALQEKERARQLEEAKRKEAETEVAKANTTIDETKDELAKRNAELEKTLLQADEQRLRAEAAKRDAELKEQQARAAEDRAKALLQREQERAERLAKQLGSPVVEVLK